MQIPYILTGYTLNTLLLFLNRFERLLRLLQKTLLLLLQTSLLSVHLGHIQITANILLLKIHQLSIIVIISLIWASFFSISWLSFALPSSLNFSRSCARARTKPLIFSLFSPLLLGCLFFFLPFFSLGAFVFPTTALPSSGKLFIVGLYLAECLL